MGSNNNTVEASYAFCRQISRRAGSNFYAGFMLLPPDQRRAMWALYAFMRHTDDLVDDPTLNQPRDKAVAAWRSSLQRALSNDWRHDNQQRLGTSVPSSLDDDCALRLLPALADTVQRFQIPHEHLFAVIDGVEMDFDRRSYETIDELQQYCERVASAVGLCCIHIWGFRGEGALEPALKAGLALQLTNILRDLKEDAATGRIYLPAEDMRQCGYSADLLQAGMADERFSRLMAFEIARAERYYAEAAELFDWLSPSGRRIFGLLMATYHTILRKMARQPAIVFRRRVRVGRLRKLQLLARWSLLPPRKGDLQ